MDYGFTKELGYNGPDQDLNYKRSHQKVPDSSLIDDSDRTIHISRLDVGVHASTSHLIMVSSPFCLILIRGPMVSDLSLSLFSC